MRNTLWTLLIIFLLTGLLPIRKSEKYVDILTDAEKVKIEQLLIEGRLHKDNMQQFLDRFALAPNRDTAIEHALDLSLSASVARHWEGVKNVVKEVPNLLKEHYQKHGFFNGTWRMVNAVVQVPFRSWHEIFAGDKGLGQNPLGTLCGAASLIIVILLVTGGRYRMNYYTILLLFLLTLTGCFEQSVNQIITQDITTEETDDLWLVTDVLAQRDELHGQIVSVVGYVGRQAKGAGVNAWVVQFWNEPVGNFEDKWKYGKAREHDNEIEKWNVCWTDCWTEGVDYGTINLPTYHPNLLPNGFPVEAVDTLSQGKQPSEILKSLDKYILKVYVQGWNGDHLTLVEIVDHTETPAEKPPISINENNPMNINEFKEQYENFYGETVSVIGWVSGFSDNLFLSFGFWDNPNDLNSDYITVLFPYDELPYMWKMLDQGLERGKQFVIKIKVYRPENHTVRLITSNGKVFEQYPFVIQWVDGKVESE